jgi:D-glycero-alpha-D-manno-heptose-7-phosphate kinase
MSFFGGGTDFPDFYKEYGGSVISTTFDKYCYVNVKHLPQVFEYSTEVIYSRIERVTDIEDIIHPAVREILKDMDLHDIRMTYEGDLPARSGLGTSSSFAVGMYNALSALQGKYVGKKELAEKAIYLERVLCREAGGIQDQIAAAYGGLNRINFSEEGFEVLPIVISQQRKKALNENLMLFFTGFSRLSSELAKTQEQVIREKKNQQLIEILTLVDEAQEVLTSQADLREFGRLLDYTWKLKRCVTNEISTDAIDELYAKAVSAGAVGGKLLGAGGGGFILFYVEKDRQQAVRKALGDLLYVPFRFENEGSKIIHFTEENQL